MNEPRHTPPPPPSSRKVQGRNNPEGAPVGLPLSPKDAAWVEAFGAQVADAEDGAHWQRLQEMVEQGSPHLDDPHHKEMEAKILEAREKFFALLTIPQETIAAFRKEHPALMPLDTLVGTLRTLHAYNLEIAKVVNALPSALSYAPEGVRAKMQNLKDLGLDGVEIVNAFPQALSYAPEGVRAKMQNLKDLGLDGVEIVNAFPQALCLAPESVREKMQNFDNLKLDGVKVVNAFPPALGYAPESVKAKMENLTSLGLEAAKVVNTQPPVLGYAPESVRGKVRLLERLLKTLRVLDTSFVPVLIGRFPAILGFNKQKLLLLGRVAAAQVSEEARGSLSPTELRSALMVPLEKYLLALDDLPQEGISVRGLFNKGKRNKFPAPKRREDALKKAQEETLLPGGKGKVARAYLRYRQAKEVKGEPSQGVPRERTSQ